MPLFPPAGPPKLVAIDILRHLPKAKIGNKLIVAMTDRYSKPTRAIPAGKKPVTYTAPIMVKEWIILFSIIDQLLTDNDPQIVETILSVV